MIRILTSVASNMFQVAVQVSNPHDVLVKLLKMKEAFPDLLLFLQIVLTVSIASTSAERCFSTIKRVKTYLRSTMSDQRLDDLYLLAIVRERSHDLLNNPSSVITRFAMLAERRLPLIK